MFRFAEPMWLIALSAVPVAWFLRRRFFKRPGLNLPGLEGVGSIKPSPAQRAAKAVWSLKYIVLILLILCMARPQWGQRVSSTLSQGINIILALDTSESMLAMDFKVKGERVTRLDAIKDVGSEFMAKRDGDRLGLVVFGTEAYTQVPLTRDYRIIQEVLKKVEIGAAGKSTAMGDAIGISLKRLKDVKSKSNVIILLTDGKNTAGQLDPMAAAGLAKEMGVKIYAIGVGSKGRAPFLVTGPFGNKRFEYYRVDMDEATLKKIADQTGGLFFRAENTDGLEKIYQTIDRLEKSTVKVKTYDDFRDLYPYFGWPALGLLALWLVLANTRFVRVP